MDLKHFFEIPILQLFAQVPNIDSVLFDLLQLQCIGSVIASPLLPGKAIFHLALQSML
jgi:hypothetical protein